MKKIIAVCLLLGNFLSLAAFAQDVAAPSAEKYQAGKHYQVIAAPVRTTDPTKVEVNEVFWYGCPHCYHFETPLEAWAKTLPADVYLERTPAVWRPAMEVHARAYYVAKQLNVLDSMHLIIFKAMQEEKKAIANENEVVALFASHGIDEASVRKAYNSFSVQSQTRQADARARSYGITGTPEIVVNGKYRVSSNEAGSQEAMLQVASFLIEKERRTLDSKK